MKKGILGEFETPDDLVRAVRTLRGQGYLALETFTPFPVPAAEAALDLPRPRLPVLAFLGGALGGALGYGVQLYCNAFDYPIDVGGRPLDSVLAFVPITFEMTVLGAATVTVLGLVLGARLPRLWQPVFEAEGFERASIDRFFLAVDAADGRFDPGVTARDLRASGARRTAAFGP
jgi:hypothetical protein